MNLPVKISGTVVVNTGRGKRLGFPTANIEVAAEFVDGVYIGYTQVDGKKLPSLIFVGAAVTFGETERFAESYILDFDLDIYGKMISMELVKRIRDNKKFAGSDELVRQIQHDVLTARTFFGIH